jgi:hypothetical protein
MCENKKEKQRREFDGDCNEFGWGYQQQQLD